MSQGTESSEADTDLEVLKDYWTIYGGFKAVVASPYFWAAVVACVALWPLWLFGDWWNLVLSVLPNLLGFSLAGYAIFLAFGNDRFREFLSQCKVGKSSAFLAITTTFMHFVIVQILALGLALLAKSGAAAPAPAGAVFVPLVWARFPLWGLGFLTFCYTLTTSLAALIAIFRLVRLLDIFNRART